MGWNLAQEGWEHGPDRLAALRFYGSNAENEAPAAMAERGVPVK